MAALQAAQAKLAAQINTLAAQGGANPSQVILSQLTSLEASYQSIYTQVTAASVAPAPATLLQEGKAGVSTASSAVNTIGLGALIGLLAAAGFALLREPFDTKVREFEEAEKTSGRPTLAQLPYARQFRPGDTPLPVVTQPRTPFAESIRELRTSAQVLLNTSATPVLLVTSPAPFDGKTLVSANLAASYALSGKLTILVSGDLRRPRIHEFFGTNETDRGLAELLDGPAPTRDDVESYLRETPVEGLYLLPPGFPHGDPADALASPAMAETFNQLRTLADIVIIDSPPVLAAADASIAASHADGVILVVRAGKTQRPALAETMKRLESAHVKVLGLAFNRVKRITGSAYRDHYLSADRGAATESLEPTADAPAATPTEQRVSEAAQRPADELNGNPSAPARDGRVDAPVPAPAPAPAPARTSTDDIRSERTASDEPQEDRQAVDDRADAINGKVNGSTSRSTSQH